MLRWGIIGLLVAGLIGTGMWGMNQSNQKEALLVQNENNYQRAFHDLSFHLDQLEDEVGSTLAMNSKEQLSSSMADVWRVTSLAQSELGQLPLGMMALHKTEAFLHKIGDFSYKTTIRDLSDKPLTDEEYEKLKQFYKESGEIKHELRKLQASALKDHQKWMDAEEAMNANEEPMDNSIVNGFQMIDEKVKGYTETEFGPENEFAADLDEQIAKKVKGEEVSREEAAKIAKEFLGVPDSMEVQVEELDKGLKFKGYTLTIQEPEGEASIHMDMTKKGGHPLWFMQARPIDEANISLNEATNQAKEFLERNGFENMEVVNGKQYDTIGSFQFVPVENGVRIYPDTVYIDVALDDGEIVNYKGAEYITNHKKRQEFKPKLRSEEAMDKVNPEVEVMEEHLALIKNNDDEEVLCYEFYGTIENDTYQIYINAENGDEEYVGKLDNAEPVYDTM
ncbi:germination protein YpeB [Alteribacillus iranensis]|uniref:Spore germination protein n=1 Tax=Alteribacillus iranensis TaxID=930128 RepID=A0A1I1ZNZ5_9BACI|nr:germination protein YpeB [Alteribacillus iranensis]SFE33544.1 spore germination protein [Alteribacillus iranensis]